MTANGYDKKTIAKVVDDYGARPEMLLQILRGVMREIGHVPDGVVRQLAEALNLSRADVHGVVSFYHDFRTTPPGKHVVKICQAEACQAMGSRNLTEHAERTLGIGLHDSSAEVTLEPAYCLGNCACSPAVMIDDKTYGRVSNERFDQLLDSMRENG